MWLWQTQATKTDFREAMLRSLNLILGWSLGTVVTCDTFGFVCGVE